MKILMIAPEPFFEERGTPFSEFYRIKALTELGHEVDLVTYPVGHDIKIEKLRIFRISNFFRLKSIPIGPSLVKIPLDVLIFFKSLKMIMKNRYDLVHTHEEAGLIGVIFRILFKKRHIYDMHSSLSEQFINFNVTRNRAVIKVIEMFEKVMLKYSDCVIAICAHLKDVAERLNKKAKVVVIENTLNPDFYGYFPSRGEVIDLKFREGKKLILYIGTFEHYQGIDIIVEAAKYLKRNGYNNEVMFACIGGNEVQQRELRRMVEEGDVSDLFYIYGRVSFITASKLINEADILLSPRKEGINTPLKIYSYLFSGKPIIATNLLTHTQILNDKIAILCEPKGEAFGNAIKELLRNEDKCRELGEAAKRYFEARYAYSKYKELVKLSVEVATNERGICK